MAPDVMEAGIAAASMAVRPDDAGDLRVSDLCLSLRQIANALLAGHELDETLRIIVDLAAETMGAAHVAILTPGEGKCLVARAGNGLYFGTPNQSIPQLSGLADIALRSLTIVFRTDLSTGADGPERALAVEHGLKGFLAIPLLYGDRAVAVLTIAFQRQLELSPEEVAALRPFAEHSAMAIERARLRATKEEQFEVASTLLAEIVDTSSVQDLGAVLTTIHDTSLRVLRCETCSIWLVEAASGRLLLAHPLGAADALLSTTARAGRSADGVAGIAAAVKKRLAVVVEDTAASDQVKLSGLLRLLGLTAFMGLPIVRDGRALGMLAVGYRSGVHRFTHRERFIAHGLADYAAVAIENARALAKLIVELMADERGRLAREVHDTLAQDLVAVNTRIDLCSNLLRDGNAEACAEELDATRQAVTVAIQEVRRSIAGLRPVELEQHGLVTALNRYLDSFSQWNSVKSSLVVRGDYTCMPVETEITLYRVAQEALTNVRKHAQASRVRVELDCYSAGTISLVIADNGHGRGPEDTPAPGRRRGMGLILLRERLEHAKGQLDVVFAPGKGTTVKATLPRRPA